VIPRCEQSFGTRHAESVAAPDLAKGRSRRRIAGLGRPQRKRADANPGLRHDRDLGPGGMRLSRLLRSAPDIRGSAAAVASSIELTD
jgi:hypothetical protein